MRTINRSCAFKRDYKRESKKRRHIPLDDLLKPVLHTLMVNQPLDMRYHDHALSGDWAGYRECHIKPDLLLIYRRSDSATLQLARLGSHSQLFS